MGDDYWWCQPVSIWQATDDLLSRAEIAGLSHRNQLLTAYSGLLSLYADGFMQEVVYSRFACQMECLLEVCLRPWPGPCLFVSYLSNLINQPCDSIRDC